MTIAVARSDDDLAWTLIEHYRDVLTAEVRTAVFVNLGAGDHAAAIRDVLNGVAAQRKTLSGQSQAEVRAWIDCRDADAEFGVLLCRAAGAA